jgi:rhodanese-related sulfurtransferase
VLTPTGVSRDDLPLMEAEVARISVEQAKAAVDSGQALLVDVRDAAAYARLHAAGARLIQLGEIEIDAAGLDLDKERWIITYCT